MNNHLLLRVFSLLFFFILPGCEKVKEEISVITDFYNIDYGGQLLDIFTPYNKNNNLLPVIFFVHGGGWNHGDKENLKNYTIGFLKKLGFLTVRANYTLSNEKNGEKQIHPCHINDISLALKWVSTNIEKYGGDPNRIIIMGHSAGAHLALLLVFDQNRLYLNKINPFIIKGLIILDVGPYLSFQDIDYLRSNIGKAYYNEIYKVWLNAFSDDETSWEDALPLSQEIFLQIPTQFLIIHSGDEYRILPNNRLIDYLEDYELEYKRIIIEDASHMFFLNYIGSYDQAYNSIFIDFLNGLFLK